MIYLKFKPISESAMLPTFATTDSTGADLYSAEEAVLAPGEFKAVGTGLVFDGVGLMSSSLSIDVQVRPRSGLAYKHGVTVLNSPGTIDLDYRGEIKVILINHGPETFHINKGDRIAQLVVAPTYEVAFKEVKFVSDTERGEGGFGSTGR